MSDPTPPDAVLMEVPPLGPLAAATRLHHLRSAVEQRINTLRAARKPTGLNAVKTSDQDLASEEVESLEEFQAEITSLIEGLE